MAGGVWSDSPLIQFLATAEFRELLSSENPPIDLVIAAGVLPRFVHFLSNNDVPMLQAVAAWSLRNIASGSLEHKRAVVEHGAVPKFVELLHSPDVDVKMQAVLALGTIMDNCTPYRDLVLSLGALKPLLAILSKNLTGSISMLCTWTLGNMFRGEPPAPFEETRAALPRLSQLLRSNDVETVTHACWALCDLSYGTNDQIQTVIDTGIGPRLIKLLRVPSSRCVVAVLKTLGNFTSGSDCQTQMVIHMGILPHLHQFLAYACAINIRRAACWIVSNITAGSTSQIQAVFDSDIIIPLIMQLKHPDEEVKRATAWAIANATTYGSGDQIHFLVSQGCIEPICDLLVCRNRKILKPCLMALDYILANGKAEGDVGKTIGVNVYAHKVEKCGGLSKLKILRSHDSVKISEKIAKILENYWSQGRC